MKCFIACAALVLLALPAFAKDKIAGSEFTLSAHVSAVAKGKETRGEYVNQNTSTGQVYGTTTMYHKFSDLTATVGDRQYTLQGKKTLELGDYKARITGKHNDEMELLLADGKVEKYKIVGVAEVPH